MGKHSTACSLKRTLLLYLPGFAPGTKTGENEHAQISSTLQVLYLLFLRGPGFCPLLRTWLNRHGLCGLSLCVPFLQWSKPLNLTRLWTRSFFFRAILERMTRRNVHEWWRVCQPAWFVQQSTAPFECGERTQCLLWALEDLMQESSFMVWARNYCVTASIIRNLSAKVL